MSNLCPPFRPTETNSVFLHAPVHTTLVDPQHQSSYQYVVSQHFPNIPGSVQEKLSVILFTCLLSR